jgi:hypothetical protein
VKRFTLPGSVPTAQREQVHRDNAEVLLGIAAALDFKQAVRDWCYTLEERQHGLTKDKFDAAESAINLLRARGLLPIDFVIDDESRKPKGIDPTSCDGSVEEELEGIWDHVSWRARNYDPLPFCQGQPYYVELMVEKIGLASLAEKPCDGRMVLVTNGRGDTDMLSRARMLPRFAEAQERGQDVVLLYIGDHDPKGLLISDGLRENLRKLTGAHFEDGTTFECDVDAITIRRLGLNYDFIVNELPATVWTNNLLTSSGKDLADPRHRDHFKPYVQNYIAKYGVRKCEANAIVTRPGAGRKQIADAIDEYLDQDVIARYWTMVEQGRAKLAKRLPGYLRKKLSEEL